MSREPSALALAVAGSATVATAFGMARYGYGLLLPDIDADLTLGTAALGAIGTLGYIAYVGAAAAVGPSVRRFGQRATVVVGGLLAVVGTLLVAAAGGPPALAVGVAVAGASAGLVYPPFADAVDRLPAAVRARTLATINCGTGWGVAVAAPIAILAGDAWRTAYVGFAACALASTLYAARTLPRRAPTDALGRLGMRREAWPVLVGAALVGLGSAAFWTFAVDHVRAAGLDATAGRALLGLAGVGSLLGIAAADLIRRLGAGRTFVATALLEGAAMVAVGAVPGSTVVVLVAGFAFGAAYNTLVAVSVLWGTRVYPDRPSTGLALTVGANAAGLLWGPLAGGIVADAVGLTGPLVGGGVVVAVAAFAAPRGVVLTGD